MSKKNKSNDLGRALIKDKFRHARRRVDNNSMLHTADIQDGYDWGRLNLQSVTEESSFQDFLRTAELAGTEFKAEKLNIKFINPKSTVGIISNAERVTLKKQHIVKKELLKIPRRPKWTPNTTMEDLKTNENLSFLEWRRNLATIQEQDELLLTPYEKNLEFWRQLWRVIEKSDVIVQIVDARNPLLFRSEDLEKYVKEIDGRKENMLLINKADFLTDEQRRTWSEYFDRQNLKVAFFSATLASVDDHKTSETNETESNDNSDDSDYGDEEDDDDEHDNAVDNDAKIVTEKMCNSLKLSAEDLSKSIERTENQLIIIENKILNNKQLTAPQFDSKLNDSSETKNSSKLLTRSELLDLFRDIYQGKTLIENIVTIGLVGYPNVGKSSTINSILIKKKVSVSTRPGKTKHFQTINVPDNNLLLCDCPGLVMPSFVVTKSDMILNGILPIDNLRDYVPPVNVLCTEIPRHILEDTYNLVIASPQEGEDETRQPYAEELLLAYAYCRGFMTSNGEPDQARAARQILKDYVCGKLLYCHAPPDIDQNEFHVYPERKRPTIDEKVLPKRQQRAMRINKTQTSEELDKSFYAENKHRMFIKGKSNFPHIRHADASSTTSLSASHSSDLELSDKPWRHQKKEKREKLRRKFAHLDQH